MKTTLALLTLAFLVCGVPSAKAGCDYVFVPQPSTTSSSLERGEAAKKAVRQWEDENPDKKLLSASFHPGKDGEIYGVLVTFESKALPENRG